LTDIQLRAGDDIDLDYGSAIRATQGLVEIEGDFDPGNAVNDEPGTTITIGAVVSADRADVRGFFGDDHFVLDLEVPDQEPSDARFTVQGDGGRDRFDLLSTASTSPATLDGQEDNDTFNISEENLDRMEGSVIVRGGDHDAEPTRAATAGGTVTGCSFAPSPSAAIPTGDQLLLHDQAASVSTTYTLEPAEVNGESVLALTVESSPPSPGDPRQVGQVAFTAIETVDLRAAAYNDVVEIALSSVDALPNPNWIRVDGGGGEDNYVAVHGTDADDAIAIVDSSADEDPEGSDDPESRSDDVPVLLEIANVSRFRVRTRAGDDTVHNQSTVPGLLEGQEGNDLLVTDRAREDVLAGGPGLDALVGQQGATGTFYLPDHAAKDDGQLTETPANGDTVIVNGNNGKVSSLGSPSDPSQPDADTICGRDCGSSTLFVNAGKLSVTCWLQAVFAASPGQIIGGPQGAQSRVYQLTAPPVPGASVTDLPSAPLAGSPVAIPDDPGDPPPVLVPTGVGQGAPVVGDANLDGRFDQFDIIQVLAAGKYMGQQPASWAEGDWDEDGLFNQFDLILALRGNTYRLGSLSAAGSTPTADSPTVVDHVLAIEGDWIGERSMQS
jgi:hypothetical protein